MLELISAIPAKNFDTSHSTDDDPLGRRPPGDYGYRTFAEWYGLPFSEPSGEHPGCVTNAEREDCINAARRELAHLRKASRRDPETLESPEQTRRLMLKETEGWTLQQIATSHWRMSPSIMRRLRVADGRNAETGLIVTEDPFGGEDLASRARQLKEQGMSRRQIAMALGVHKFQVERFLRRAA